MPRYAAVDIGSNSVRMQAAEVGPDGSSRILASDREVTRIGSSVFRGGQISPETIDAVSAVLARMAAEYGRLGVDAVRAVATSAVRDASNQADFIKKASAAVGTTIEIISGPEEARLIHLGVQSHWPHPDQNIMVIDVGGGSCEIIVGEQGELQEGLSRPLGAVRLTEVFLKSDPPTATELKRMESYIEERLASVHHRVGHRSFDRVVGTSATAAAIVSAVHRVPRTQRDQADKLSVTLPQIQKVYEQLCTLSLAERKKVTGVGPRRAEIIISGVAVFLRTLEMFGLETLHYSTAGVRDGIIADLIARGTVETLSRLNRQQLRLAESMCRKYGVPLKHGRQVSDLAKQLFEGFQPLHTLPAAYGKLLEAAAYLHDAGHFISDTAHHKHSAYLVNNSDMPGFTDRERAVVAMLCRYHRKSLPSPRHDPYQALPLAERRAIAQLTPLLRVADGLDTSHEQKVRGLSCHRRGDSMVLTLEGSGDFDLEVWAAERAADAVRQVYGCAISIDRGTAKRQAR